MLRKFLNGIVFGAGFAVAFIVVVAVYFQYFFNPSFEHKLNSKSDVVGTPPAVQEQKKYLGSQGIFNGSFKQSGNVLIGGPGEIVGKVTVNDKPVAGIKLRLALNGSVMSQWATSEAAGIYRVLVPYGEYRIDGYELDGEVADSVLAGKIASPQNPFASDTFKVVEDSKGRGLDLRYVDPIEKKITKKIFSVSENVVISWAPYTGAVEYSIQMYEKSDPNDYRGNNTLFDWSKQPKVSGTTFSLKEQGVKLKVGKFYLVEISAYDKERRNISETANRHSGYDFEVTE